MRKTIPYIVLVSLIVIALLNSKILEAPYKLKVSMDVEIQTTRELDYIPVVLDDRVSIINGKAVQVNKAQLSTIEESIVDNGKFKEINISTTFEDMHKTSKIDFVNRLLEDSSGNRHRITEKQAKNLQNSTQLVTNIWKNAQKSGAQITEEKTDEYIVQTVVAQTQFERLLITDATELYDMMSDRLNNNSSDVITKFYFNRVSKELEKVEQISEQKIGTTTVKQNAYINIFKENL